MRKMTSLMLIGYCSMLFSSAALKAQENENKNIRPGERAESVEARKMLFDESAELASEHEAKSKASVKANVSKSARNKMAAKSIYYTSHPATFQHPTNISYYGNTIELTDGSVWSVSSSYAYMTTGWYATDLVVITPNHSWFSGYHYMITNQSTGQSVPANLDLGPIAPAYGSPYTHWIASMDYLFHTIYLEDGSVWDMSIFDRNITDNWVPGDVVIIGVNDGYFSYSKPNILINVATLTHAAGSSSY